MTNLEIYEKVRSVPDNAKKPIQAGRLKGKTDINPMWRIKVLTETFGICGFGWKYEVIEKRLEKVDSGEVAAFVDINLYIKVEGEWSEAIPGTGGSSFIAKEKAGLYVSDECFKMALTDAISVACKALGIGADVYWNADVTKYNNYYNNTPQQQYQQPQQPPQPQQNQQQQKRQLTPREMLIIKLKQKGIDAKAFANEHQISQSTTDEEYARLLALVGD